MVIFNIRILNKIFAMIFEYFSNFSNPILSSVWIFLFLNFASLNRIHFFGKFIILRYQFWEFIFDIFYENFGHWHCYFSYSVINITKLSSKLKKDIFINVVYNSSSFLMLRYWIKYSKLSSNQNSVLLNQLLFWKIYYFAL